MIHFTYEYIINGSVLEELNIMKILLMEDDPVLSDILLDYLNESWNVDYAYDSVEVYKKLLNFSKQTTLELLMQGAVQGT